jgi:cyclopropane fatty-acyl-phospholipid synthase-like methyltransferase
VYNWRQKFSNAAKNNKSTYRPAFRRGDLTYQDIYEILDQYLDFKEGDCVADIGASTGTISRIVSQKVKQVVSVDYSPEQLELSKKYNKKDKIDNILVLESSLPLLENIENEYFDKIIVGSVFQYLDVNNRNQIQESLENLFRIMKKGATACLYHHYGNEYKKAYENKKPEWYNHIFWTSFDEISDICSNLGFQVCEKISFCANSEKIKNKIYSLETVENPNLGLNILLKK